MTEWALLATGPSMSKAVADSVRSMHRVCVNDAYKLAPDADALCASDRLWWTMNPGAEKFAGRKFSTNPPSRHTVERVATTPTIQSASNSSLLALHVAIKVFGATVVYLYGLDMSAKNGAHYFGPHVGLANTKPHRFEVFRQQFWRYAQSIPKSVKVFNATPGSALECFPFLN